MVVEEGTGVVRFEDIFFFSLQTVWSPGNVSETYGPSDETGSRVKCHRLSSRLNKEFEPNSTTIVSKPVTHKNALIRKTKFEQIKFVFSWSKLHQAVERFFTLG